MALRMLSSGEEEQDIAECAMMLTVILVPSALLALSVAMRITLLATPS